MRKNTKLGAVENVVETVPQRLLRRLTVTSIAVFAVLAAVIIKAVLLGDFVWLIG